MTGGERGCERVKRRLKGDEACEPMLTSRKQT